MAQQQQQQQQLEHPAWRFDGGPLHSTTRFSKDPLPVTELLELQDYQVKRKQKLAKPRKTVDWKTLCQFTGHDRERCGRLL